jgi:hypothetical protein
MLTREMSSMSLTLEFVFREWRVKDFARMVTDEDEESSILKTLREWRVKHLTEW